MNYQTQNVKRADDICPQNIIKVKWSIPIPTVLNPEIWPSFSGDFVESVKFLYWYWMFWITWYHSFCKFCFIQYSILMMMDHLLWCLWCLVSIVDKYPPHPPPHHRHRSHNKVAQTSHCRAPSLLPPHQQALVSNISIKWSAEIVSKLSKLSLNLT